MLSTTPPTSTPDPATTTSAESGVDGSGPLPPGRRCAAGVSSVAGWASVLCGLAGGAHTDQVDAVLLETEPGVDGGGAEGPVERPLGPRR